MRDIYESQRMMRRMRESALSRGVVGVLDIGTSKIACLILRFDRHLAKADSSIGAMAGQARFRVIGAATTRSRGVRFGEIEAMPETERAIRTAVQAAQKMAATRVDHVIACFAGAAPRSYGLEGRVEIDGPHITQNDISRVLSACELPDIGAGREILHAQPVNFAVDHRTGLRDPRGQVGSELATDMHLVSVNSAALNALSYCIRRCDLELAGVTSSAYVAGRAALIEDEQELGAACIDMGGGATSISLFVKRHMIYADSLAIGGDHITKDISIGLQIPFSTAERIKTFNGGVLATGIDDRDMIAIGSETGDWERDRREISRAELIGIMRPRLEEILEEVRARLDAAGFSHLPNRQIVLTGGSSQTPGLETLAARILGQQIRLGRPLRVHGLPQAATGPGFSAPVGLCLYAAHPQDEWWDFDMPVEQHAGKSFKRAIRWFRENW